MSRALVYVLWLLRKTRPLIPGSIGNELLRSQTRTWRLLRGIPVVGLRRLLIVYEEFACIFRFRALLPREVDAMDLAPPVMVHGGEDHKEDEPYEQEEEVDH